MEEKWCFSADEYDLDGLLRISEEAMADLVFMIEDEESGLYYLDRGQNQKYDSSFNRFLMRVKDYLEVDETNSLFVLFASGKEGEIKVFDGNHRTSKELDTGDVELEEGTFYGMMIHCTEGNYVFHETVYTRESYEGDTRAKKVQEVGDVSAIMDAFILEFK